MVKHSKVAKLNLQLGSFRKINSYYNQNLNEEKKHETKGFPYVNKGIFRQTAQAYMAFNGRYLLRINGTYES